MRRLMTGNEALARGAWESGVRFASAYPGTPSTEILVNMKRFILSGHLMKRLPWRLL